MSDVLERFALVGALQKGAHEDQSAMCVMEAVAFVAGEPWSDHPECACPVICAFMQSWNDGLPDVERDALLRPLIPRLIGTRSTKEVERRRAVMAADWLVRTHTPAWLRLAGLTEQADAIASLPEITDFLQCPSLMPTLRAARTDADAAGSAAGSAAWNAAWDAAWAAAGAAARDAAGDAAGGAACAAAGAAAWAAACAAAVDAPGDALKATKLQLQQSALALVERMLAVTAE